MSQFLFIFGTRPEIIKHYPLIALLQKQTSYSYAVCHTGQHKELADQVVQFFNIPITYDLHLMQKGQKLEDFTSKSIQSLSSVIQNENPSCVFVQGDTSTAFCGALAAYYYKVKVAHIEAGLRSYDKLAPFPEEINRKIVGTIADFHFAPTDKAVENLRNEGITSHVWNVGNTVLDALFLTLNTIKSQGEERYFSKFSHIDFNKRIVLVTCHRRENFGKPFEQICTSLLSLSNQFKDCEFIYPVHPNPHVKDRAHEFFRSIKNVHCIEPLDYPTLVWLMNKSYLVMTDSGGIQEEAPSLGKPVLVLREVTERVEGIAAGNAILVGTNPDKIISTAQILLTSSASYQKMVHVNNPYGDGKTAEKILRILEKII